MDRTQLELEIEKIMIRHGIVAQLDTDLYEPFLQEIADLKVEYGGIKKFKEGTRVRVTNGDEARDQHAEVYDGEEGVVGKGMIGEGYSIEVLMDNNKCSRWYIPVTALKEVK